MTNVGIHSQLVHSTALAVYCVFFSFVRLYSSEIEGHRCRLRQQGCCHIVEHRENKLLLLFLLNEELLLLQLRL